MAKTRRLKSTEQLYPVRSAAKATALPVKQVAPKAVVTAPMAAKIRLKAKGILAGRSAAGAAY